ncbi:MAG: glycerophosphodiester phosphodiesterase family protein [Proteobacteria bacterium]|nr:glycerophosphodiester phosphodiesterase family protein [Pseudomonadota bacterium]
MRPLVFAILLYLSSSCLANPLVIAHRGASGYYPEHTLEAYRAAILMGADYIEPDLVLTADGQFVARHDLYLGNTTNVAAIYPDRRRDLDGRSDWYVMDFTLAELQQLRARQPFDDRSASHDDQFTLPTLAQIIQLLKAMEVSEGRTIGLYPELKSPQVFRRLGFDMGPMLLQELDRLSVSENVIIQSFDQETLEALRPKTAVPLVMLVYPKSRLQPTEPNVPLAEIARFADGVGAMKTLLVHSGEDTGLVSLAHDLGLFVHAWTFRDDRYPDTFSSSEAELRAYLSIGIDGFFTDFPDTAVAMRNRFMERNRVAVEP